MDFRKSSYSNGSGGECVEVAADGAVYVRDTKQDGRAVVTFTPGAWGRFTAAIR